MSTTSVGGNGARSKGPVRAAMILAVPMTLIQTEHQLTEPIESPSLSAADCAPGFRRLSGATEG